MGGQVSCQHVLFAEVEVVEVEVEVGGGGLTVAVSGDLIIWWTPQWRGRAHTGLSRVAHLIRPLLMQSGERHL